MILLLAGGLRFYRISSLFSFEGDVAWDYFSAKQFLTGGKFPLIGISSSVPWLHQGAFFTYILIVLLGLFKFNPIAPPIFCSLLGIATTFLVFWLGKKFFSAKAGLWAAFFYAFSPLAIAYDRFPYHLSPIAFFTCLFFLSLYQALKKPKFFILSALLLGVLLQFEIANLVLVPVLGVFFGWQRRRISVSLLVLAILAFLLPWLPKIVYDFFSGFTQTLGLAAWLGHKLLPFGFWPDIGQGPSFSLLNNLQTLSYLLSRLIFPASGWFSLFFLGIFLGFFFLSPPKKKSFWLICSWLAFPLLGFLLHGSPSESYFPVWFPLVALLSGYSFSLVKGKWLFRGSFLLALFWAYGSSLYLLKNDFLLGYKAYFSLRKVAEYVIADASGAYNLVPVGSYAEFPSNQLSLLYLTDYLGKPAQKNKAKTVYIIYYNEERTIDKAIEEKQFSYLTVVKKER